MPASHVQRRNGRAAIAVAAVTALAGLLFATNARLVTGQSAGGAGLLSLVRQTSQRVTAEENRAADLSNQISRSAANSSTNQVTNQASAGLLTAAGSTAVTGPGVIVTLNDAPAPHRGPLDAYVVHQQDIEAVINVLWASGAEALALQGVRLTAITSIQCVGNVLLVGGRVFSPPYRLEAIGPSDQLIDGLANSTVLSAYRQAVNDLGLGWKVDTALSLHLPGEPSGSIGLRYISVADNSSETGEES
ncbi:MAG: DUF881 domain-containing protein [Bifidobacteriaceae bacterium]|nr:DUF881 domain-containing protein [Bifidobacteriaceae bacterium]